MSTEEQLQELLSLENKIEDLKNEIRILEAEYKKNVYKLRLQEIEKKRKVMENVVIAHRNLNEVFRKLG